MDFTRKLAAARTWLDARGIAPAAAAPPFFRVCWRLGLPLAPPHFRVGRQRPDPGQFLWGRLGLCMAGLVAIGLLPRRPMPVRDFVATFSLAALAAGVMFGLWMGFYYRRDARKHAIPAWSDFTPGPAARH